MEDGGVFGPGLDGDAVSDSTAFIGEHCVVGKGTLKGPMKSLLDLWLMAAREEAIDFGVVDAVRDLISRWF